MWEEATPQLHFWVKSSQVFPWLPLGFSQLQPSARDELFPRRLSGAFGCRKGEIWWQERASDTSGATSELFGI